MCNERVVRFNRTTELTAEIEREAEQFFEWPTNDKSAVTYTSALLFAEHCVKEATKEESDLLLTIAYMDGRRQGQIDRLGGK